MITSTYSIALTTNKETFVCTWNSTYQLTEINIGVSMEHFFYHVPCMLTLQGPYEWPCFLHQFGYGCHYECNFFNETLI